MYHCLAVCVVYAPAGFFDERNGDEDSFPEKDDDDDNDDKDDDADDSCNKNI